MRNLLIIVIGLLAPFAMWTAGCRQNEQASAFPKGPEAKKLARASGKGVRDPQAPPVIPTAIDPEVLNTPDQLTFGRIRAVMDREAVLTGQYSEPGLFVLPRQDMSELAVAVDPAVHQSRQMTQHDMPILESDLSPALAEASSSPRSGRPQFWSRPSDDLQAPDPFFPSSSDDVSAMKPATPIPSMRMPAAPVMPMQGMAVPEPSFAPESVPGVFMGTGESDFFDSRTPLSSAGPPRMEGVAAVASDFLAGPAKQASRLDALPNPAAYTADPATGKMPAGDAVVPLNLASTDSIPLASADADMTQPTGKVAAILAKASVADALAPLAPLNGSAAAKVRTPPAPVAAPPVSAPSLMTWAPLPPSAAPDTDFVDDSSPAALPPPPELAEPSGAAPSDKPATTWSAAPAGRDLFMTDFWEKPAPVQAGVKPAAKEEPTGLSFTFDPAALDKAVNGGVKPKAPAEAAAPAAARAETKITGVTPILDKPAAAPSGTKADKAKAEKPGQEKPEKVVLSPSKEKKVAAELKHIDSQMEPPPLRF